MLFKNIAVLDENYQIKENMYVSTAGEQDRVSRQRKAKR